MVAIPEFKKFLVHCESTLSSYVLDDIVRVSQDATSKCLEEPELNLAEEDGAVSFLKVGRIDNRTFGRRFRYIVGPSSLLIPKKLFTQRRLPRTSSRKY
jgi:hypothetical protein